MKNHLLKDWGVSCVYMSNSANFSENISKITTATNQLISWIP